MRTLLCLGLLLVLAPPCEAQLDRAMLPMREWSSTDGRTIRAELLGFEEGGVRLRLEGGQRALVPEDRLSPSDRAELVRVRLRELYWTQPGEAANTNYYYSKLTLADKAHEGIVAMVRVGPNRFLFELKIHSKAVDLRRYQRIDLLASDGQTISHGYPPQQAVAWGDPPDETTRVVIQTAAADQAGLLPVLQAGLRNGGALAIAAIRTGESTPLPMTDVERQALSDVLAIYLAAQPLLREGAIQAAPLDGQDFAKAKVTSGPTSPASSVPPSEGNAPELSPEESAELARLSSGRGGGRLGEIGWVPEEGATQPVRGLGWIRNLVVIRPADGEIRLVPFAEIAPDVRKKVLSQRLKDFSGTRPPSTPHGVLHFPEGWSKHQQENSQGLVFCLDTNGAPHLVVQGVTTKFKGKPISEIAIRGNSARDFVAVPIPAGASRAVDGNWSLATTRLGPALAQEMSKLAESHSLDIRLSSGSDSTTFALTGDHLVVTLEALQCYEWALLADNP